MGTIIDILGSMIVRASIVMVILNLMINLHEALYKSTERVYLSETINAPMQTISADLNLAGYGSTNKNFLIARTNQFSFRTDIDDDGDVDSVRYYLDPGTGTFKVLKRAVNITSGASNTRTIMDVAYNVISFSILYYTVNGTAPSGTTNVAGIKSVNIKLVIQNQNNMTYKDTGTSDTLTVTRQRTWQQLYFPENL